jgi:uncharacterized membrane protein
MRFKLFRKSKFDKIIDWSASHFTLLLVIGVVAAMIISLSVGMMQSVWFDEAYSIAVSQQPLARMVHLISVDTHPPLYYLLLSVWGNLFGWGEFALRSFSVLAMGGAAALAGLLTKKLFGSRTAVITLPFIVLAPFLLRYGFEIRMYALASLIGIAATYVLVLAVQAKRNRVWLFGLYAVLVAVGVYTLYYTVLLWLAHFIWLVWQSRSNKQPIIKSDWFRAYLLSVALFLPWMPSFITQITGGALAQISQSMTVDNLLGIVSFSFLFEPIWRLGPWQSLVILFVLAMLVYLSVRAFKLVDKKQKKYLVLFGLYFAIPIVLLTLVGLVKPMYVERYLSHVLIGASIYVGVIVSVVIKKSNNALKTLSALLIAAMAIGIFNLYQTGNYNFQRLQKPDVKSAAAYVSKCDNESVVFASDPYEAIELGYYLPKCKIYFSSAPNRLIGGYTMLYGSSLLTSDPADRFKNNRVIYYFYYTKDSTIKMPKASFKEGSVEFGSLTVEKIVTK